MNNIVSSSDTMVHVVSTPTSGIGFIEDPEDICAQLLVRSNGTNEGEEPWRLQEA
jgi:hypothetical protein